MGYTTLCKIEPGKTKFKPEISELVVDYHPEEIISDLTQLLCNVIAFTPQTFKVELNISRSIEAEVQYLIIEVKNDGSNLSRLGEIIPWMKDKRILLIPPIRYLN